MGELKEVFIFCSLYSSVVLFSLYMFVAEGRSRKMVEVKQGS